MLTAEQIVRQASQSIDASDLKNVIDMDKCEQDIRTRISTAFGELLSKKASIKVNNEYVDVTRRVIEEYVLNQKPVVKGFINSDGTANVNLLKNNLIDTFTKNGVLEAAIQSDSVTEIQCNDYDCILIEENGVLRRYTEERVINGVKQIVPKSFGSQKRYKNWVQRLLLEDNKTLTEQNAIVDCISSTGIRVHVDGEAATVCERGVPGRNYNPIYVTLRKQPKKKWTAEELISLGTYSTGIAKMFQLIPATLASTFLVGETGCGKTVDVNIIADNVDPDVRVFASGNPPELRLFKRDPVTHTIINNVIHLKATNWQGDLSSMPPGFPDTLNHLKAAFRVTPKLAIMEEMRVFREFERFISLATSGHAVLSTFHSGTVPAAITRITTELQSANPALTRESILDTLAVFLKFIITKMKLSDGSRKVMAIAEICGTYYDEHGNKQLKINYLYEFRRDAEAIPPGQKATKAFQRRKVVGAHYRVGSISEEFQDKLRLTGLVDSQFEFCSKPLEIDPETKLPIPERDTYVYETLFEEENSIENERVLLDQLAWEEASREDNSEKATDYEIAEAVGAAERKISGDDEESKPTDEDDKPTQKVKIETHSKPELSWSELLENKSDGALLENALAASMGEVYAEVISEHTPEPIEREEPLSKEPLEAESALDEIGEYTPHDTAVDTKDLVETEEPWPEEVWPTRHTKMLNMDFEPENESPAPIEPEEDSAVEFAWPETETRDPSEELPWWATNRETNAPEVEAIVNIEEAQEQSEKIDLTEDTTGDTAETPWWEESFVEESTSMPVGELVEESVEALIEEPIEEPDAAKFDDGDDWSSVAEESINQLSIEESTESTNKSDGEYEIERDNTGQPDTKKHGLFSAFKRR